MVDSILDCATLPNGVKIPWLGFGVFKIPPGQETQAAVQEALEAGYRSFDTASFYANEEDVGKVLRACRIPRKELFITTKVWNSDQGFDSTLKAFDESMGKLDLDYIDLFLIHWPVAGRYKDTWVALEKLYEQGLVNAIGVSNFLVAHLEDVLDGCQVNPMVNQVEFHPRLLQPELLEFCKNHDIKLEAWSPLMSGRALSEATITRIAEAHGKTAAQVVLRWDLQHGVVTIPKSVHRERMEENAAIFDFELTLEEMSDIDALDRGQRVGPDPATFDF